MTLPLRTTADAPTGAQLGDLAAVNLCNTLHACGHDIVTAAEGMYAARKGDVSEYLATAEASIERARMAVRAYRERG